MTAWSTCPPPWFTATTLTVRSWLVAALASSDLTDTMARSRPGVAAPAGPDRRSGTAAAANAMAARRRRRARAPAGRSVDMDGEGVVLGGVAGHGLAARGAVGTHLGGARLEGGVGLRHGAAAAARVRGAVAAGAGLGPSIGTQHGGIARRVERPVSRVEGHLEV